MVVDKFKLKPCPFCGRQPIMEECDRLITIGCKPCGYTRHFNGLVQAEIDTGVPVHYLDGTISNCEWYDKDAEEKAVKKWNTRYKETPKKPIEMRINLDIVSRCDNCGADLDGERQDNYCPNCGQKIDWSEESDNNETN